jgi:hypothetical protein
MPKQEEIIAVNAPTIEYYQEARSWSASPVGVVYSISLANGMVLTSPQAFENFQDTPKEPSSRPRLPEPERR